MGRASHSAAFEALSAQQLMEKKNPPKRVFKSQGDSGGSHTEVASRLWALLSRIATSNDMSRSAKIGVL